MIHLKIPHKPVSATSNSKGKGRSEFFDLVRGCLEKYPYYFSHDISIIITLYFHDQDVYETSDVGDLDNYSKAILDALKGPKGLFFDDNQVQSLQISRLDIPSNVGSFELEIDTATEEDILIGDVRFYEMPNCLLYPESNKYFCDKDRVVKDKTYFDQMMVVGAAAHYRRKNLNIRRSVRAAGGDRVQAWHTGERLSNIRRLYHPSRIDGFEIVKYKEWDSAFSKYLSANSREFEVYQRVIEFIDKYAETVSPEI